MPKNSPETIAKRKATAKENEAKHVFDLCGWEVWVDPLNYEIRKGGITYYYSTFINTLRGLREEVNIRLVRNSNELVDAINKVEENDERFIRSLKEILDSHTSLGELKWN